MVRSRAIARELEGEVSPSLSLSASRDLQAQGQLTAAVIRSRGSLGSGIRRRTDHRLQLPQSLLLLCLHGNRNRPSFLGRDTSNSQTAQHFILRRRFCSYCYRKNSIKIVLLDRNTTLKLHYSPETSQNLTAMSSQDTGLGSVRRPREVRSVSTAPILSAVESLPAFFAHTHNNDRIPQSTTAQPPPRPPAPLNLLHVYNTFTMVY